MHWLYQISVVVSIMSFSIMVSVCVILMELLQYLVLFLSWLFFGYFV